MKEKILEIIKNKKTLSYSIHDFKKALNLSKQKVDEEISLILNELECEGVIYLAENGMYHKFPHNYKIASISVSKTGKYSAVTKEDRYSICSTELNGALCGDIVIIDNKNVKDCKVVKVLKRKCPQIICEVKLRRDGQKFLEPCNLSQKFNVSIGRYSLKNLTEGQRILVELSTEKCGDYYDATYIKTVGYRNDPDIELKTIAITNGFNFEYSEEAIKELEMIPCEVLSSDKVGRLDLTKEQIFTIDGISTKDIDDAVSIKKLPNGNFELSTHIAHVSHYIKKGTALWDEAYNRGNSLYLLDSVIPMLPQKLSNGICSLNEGEDRLTRSVIMQIDLNGNIVDFRIVKSIINSKKKMTYENINVYYNTGEVPQGYEPFTDSLDLMKELSTIISEKRKKDGSIDFDGREVEFVVENNNITGSVVRHQDEAEKLIENFMIYTNCTVAQYAYYLDLPFVYRVHGIPNGLKLDSTIKLLNSIGCRLERINNEDNPRVIQKMLATLSNKDNYPVLSTFILKAMKKAEYNTTNYGHYGLSEECYTHFTSPIRRLNDLVVHTLLDYYESPEAENISSVLSELEFELKDICEKASIQERNADRAEYQAYKLASVKLMADHVGESFNGYIYDITPHYICVKTEDLIEGKILLENKLYEYDGEKSRVKLLDINKTLKIGDRITLLLCEANKEHCELYFDVGNPLILSRKNNSN